MYRDGGVDSSEFWALYLWVLGPYAKTTNLLEPDVIESLVYSNASSEAIEDAQNTVFSKSDENLEKFKIVSKELQSALEDKFLNLDSMDNEVFTQDCINLMTENYKIKFYATYSNETSVLIYILTLALRSIIMDTLKVNIAEQNHRRRFGFFLTSIRKLTTSATLIDISFSLLLLELNDFINMETLMHWIDLMIVRNQIYCLSYNFFLRWILIFC
jgi:hypothetical protein